jgi:hypothetical protein
MPLFFDDDTKRQVLEGAVARKRIAELSWRDTVVVKVPFQGYDTGTRFTVQRVEGDAVVLNDPEGHPVTVDAYLLANVPYDTIPAPHDEPF